VTTALTWRPGGSPWRRWLPRLWPGDPERIGQPSAFDACRCEGGPVVLMGQLQAERGHLIGLGPVTCQFPTQRRVDRQMLDQAGESTGIKAVSSETDRSEVTAVEPEEVCFDGGPVLTEEPADFTDSPRAVP